MRLIKRLQDHWQKSAIESAIKTAQDHADRYREEITKLTPPNAPIGEQYMHVMECHDRMVLRLKAKLAQQFPEPRYRRILK